MAKKERSITAKMIDDTKKIVFPGADPLDTLPRSIARLGYALRSKKSRESDSCIQNKKILKEPTGYWYDNPGSADVLGIDMPTIEVKEHERTMKNGKKVTVKKHRRKGRKFPGYC